MIQNYLEEVRRTNLSTTQCVHIASFHETSVIDQIHRLSLAYRLICRLYFLFLETTAFHRLQCGKTWRAWYLFSHEHDVISK